MEVIRKAGIQLLEGEEEAWGHGDNRAFHNEAESKKMSGNL